MDTRKIKRLRGAQPTNDSIDNENGDDDDARERDCLDTEEVLLGSLYVLHKEMKDKMDALQTIISRKKRNWATTSDATINYNESVKLHLTSEPSRITAPSSEV